MPTCRLLPYAVMDGPHNMAADEVVLEAAAAGVASLRFYGWSDATVSLGYFQAERLRRSDPLLTHLPYVRRPSGGMTLVHHHELTYALGLPAGMPWHDGEPWLVRMHQIIVTALAACGVIARLHCPVVGEHFSGLLCFRHFTAGDILVGSSKVVGSAQRRQRGALLQHGGILLAASPYTPVLPGIRELSQRDITVSDTCAAVVEALRNKVGWELIIADWMEPEQQRLENLAKDKYSQDSWNAKR